MTTPRPNKKHSKHVKRLRNGHCLSSGTAKVIVITLSNCTTCVFLPCIEFTNLGTEKLSQQKKNEKQFTTETQIKHRQTSAQGRQIH